jgi:hypothetical protein
MYLLKECEEVGQKGKTKRRNLKRNGEEVGNRM